MTGSPASHPSAPICAGRKSPHMSAHSAAPGFPPAATRTRTRSYPQRRIVMSGLGRGLRIGDTLLNPSSARAPKVRRSDHRLPLELDRPIDSACRNSGTSAASARVSVPATPSLRPRSCQRHEIWKADVEKCTRIVLPKRASACGRCMKNVSWNAKIPWRQRRLVELSINVPAPGPPLSRRDDELQNGKRNLIKKWCRPGSHRWQRPCASVRHQRARPEPRTRCEARRSPEAAMFPPILQPRPDHVGPGVRSTANAAWRNTGKPSRLKPHAGASAGQAIPERPAEPPAELDQPPPAAPATQPPSSAARHGLEYPARVPFKSAPTRTSTTAQRRCSRTAETARSRASD